MYFGKYILIQKHNKTATNVNTPTKTDRLAWVTCFLSTELQITLQVRRWILLQPWVPPPPFIWRQPFPDVSPLAPGCLPATPAFALMAVLAHNQYPSCKATASSLPSLPPLTALSQPSSVVTRRYQHCRAAGLLPCQQIPYFWPPQSSLVTSCVLRSASFCHSLPALRMVISCVGVCLA